MTKTISFGMWLLLGLAFPGLGLAHVVKVVHGVDKRAWSIRTAIASLAIGAISAVCSVGGTLPCLIATVGSLMITILSGFGNGNSGGNGSGLPTRSLQQRVQHHFPNGSFAYGLQFDELVVGQDHRVTLDGGAFEATATRIESGHVRLSAQVDQQQQQPGGGALLARAARQFFRRGVQARSGDDNPGDTGFVDVLFRDLDIGGTGLRNDGGSSGLAHSVGEAVANTMVNDQAETVCAALINPDTNGEIIATEWFIRANDGSSGSTPSGACDNA
ncbi:hypothetical protein B0H66DRAFT_528754 [Apodospora peruviana]|uniref:Uncharacterized protein n=1 Tax=Apodospora peruviana TaxID=516989 RepID=A0AAE0IUY6_9PEZI|nr:hypothetical protein B0H66DRAFT_528754 [Apodospora peruviana]